MFANNVLYPMTYSDNLVISVSKGNQKLGKRIYNFNLLPGEGRLMKKDGTVLTNIAGTCSGCCDGCEKFCYAVRDTIMHHNSCIPALAKNTMMVRNNIDEVFKQLKMFCELNKVEIMRFHSSGEIESYKYLLKMVELAKALPKVRFYFYTKRFAFLERYLKENGAFPVNLVANVSEWNGNTDGYDLKGLNRFVYDDGHDPEIAKMVHCPAVDKKGHKTGITCSQCQRCTRHTGEYTAVYSH